jgi:hypothetical protein
MKTMVVADKVAPRQNDMTFPLRVMKVMPTATQPTKDIVVSSDRILVVERNPGVARAAMTRLPPASIRTRMSTRLRRDRGRLSKPPDVAIGWTTLPEG